jgi:hypothetical protein
MMQIKIEINGILVEFVNVTNVTPLAATGKAILPTTDTYQVDHQQTHTVVEHDRRDGAIKLAALALTKLTEEKQ